MSGERPRSKVQLILWFVPWLLVASCGGAAAPETGSSAEEQSADEARRARTDRQGGQPGSPNPDGGEHDPNGATDQVDRGGREPESDAREPMAVTDPPDGTVDASLPPLTAQDGAMPPEPTVPEPAAPDPWELDPVAGNPDFRAPDCGSPGPSEGEICGTSERPCRVREDLRFVGLGGGPSPPALSLAVEPDRVHLMSRTGYALRQDGAWRAVEPHPDRWERAHSIAVDGSGTLFSTAYADKQFALFRRSGGTWEHAGVFPAGYQPRSGLAMIGSGKCLHAAVYLHGPTTRDRAGPAYVAFDGHFEPYPLGPRVQSHVYQNHPFHAVGPNGDVHLAYLKDPDYTLYWASPPGELEVIRTQSYHLARYARPLAVARDETNPDGFVVHVAWRGKFDEDTWGIALSTRVAEDMWQEKLVLEIPPQDLSHCEFRPSVDRGKRCEATIETGWPLAVFVSEDGTVRILLYRARQSDVFISGCPIGVNEGCPAGACPDCGIQTEVGRLLSAELVMAHSGGGPFSLQPIAAVGRLRPDIQVPVRLDPDGNIHVAVPIGREAVRYLQIGF